MDSAQFFKEYKKLLSHSRNPIAPRIIICSIIHAVISIMLCLSLVFKWHIGIKIILFVVFIASFFIILKIVEKSDRKREASGFVRRKEKICSIKLLLKDMNLYSTLGINYLFDCFEAEISVTRNFFNSLQKFIYFSCSFLFGVVVTECINHYSLVLLNANDALWFVLISIIVCLFCLWWIGYMIETVLKDIILRKNRQLERLQADLKYILLQMK